MLEFSGERRHPISKRVYRYAGSFSERPGIGAWTAKVTTDGNSVQDVAGDVQIVEGQDAMRTMIDHIEHVIDLRYPAPR